ncbi:MAG: hypothetical protein AAF208_03455 [Cyanobacteria bacterium P01_A01_bin.45]
MSNPYSNNISNNLDVSAATYLGGAGDDLSKAIDISLDGEVVLVGGTFTSDFGAEKTTLLGGGDGSIIRYDSQTNQVLSVTELPETVFDIQVSENGNVAVAYKGGIAVLNSDATEVKWNKSITGASRISISESGNLAVVQDINNNSDQVVLFNAQGDELQSWETGSDARHYQDVVITDENGGQVFATGYDQKAIDLQVAFTQSWSYGGEQQWKNYDYNPNDLKAESLTADTRGERLTIGQDGELYIAHYINGGTGASLFSREALNLSESSDEETVVTDKYNNPFNTGSMSMIYYGQYDLGSGELIQGQSLLGRRSGDRGNTVKVYSIDATENGTVILGGTAAYGIENREELTIEEQQVNPYIALDGYIAVISPDFQERLAWTPISQSSNAVAATRDGLVAVTASTNYSGNQITHNSVQSNKGSTEDGYLLIIGGNDSNDIQQPTTPQSESNSGVVDRDYLTNYGENNQQNTVQDSLGMESIYPLADINLDNNIGSMVQRLDNINSLSSYSISDRKTLEGVIAQDSYDWSVDNLISLGSVLDVSQKLGVDDNKVDVEPVNSFSYINGDFV